MGVGSLQMNQETPGGRSSADQHVRADRAAAADPRRPRPGAGPAHPPRPWLGVYSQDAGPNVVVIDVSPGGPADRAELRQGDVILAVAGQSVTGLADFYTKLWALGPAGVAAPLRLRRERDVFDVEVRTIDRTARLKKRRFN